MNIFTQFFSRGAKDPEKRRQAIMTDLMRREAKIGGKIFGPVPKGGSREFFCLNDTTWVWFEQSMVDGLQQTKTTRYVARDRGVFKSINDGPYQSVSQQEADNLEQAVDVYVERVNAELYANVAHA